jgi:hypothetical protein
MGRIMAHAYVQELGLIGQSMEKEAGKANLLSRAGETAKEVGRTFMGKNLEKTKVPAQRAKALLQHTKDWDPTSKIPAEMKAEMPGRGKGIKDVGELKDVAKQTRGTHYKELAKTWGARAGGGAAAAGIGLGAHHALKKEESALDVVASELAFNKAAEAGWDQEEAAQRLTAVLALGPTETEKVAEAESYEDAVDTRALELLAMAGYPIVESEA